MTNKVFRTSVVSIMMLAGLTVPSASAITPTAEQAPGSPATQQVMVPATGIDSKEVSTVDAGSPAPEQLKNKTSRKGMTQEEKKKNAETNDGYGVGITIIAMLIVIAALALLSILFMFFGKIFSSAMTRKKLKSQGLSKEAAQGNNTPDSGDVIAAIAMALAEHIDGKGHDMERTILTLRRMKRAYSPWNSKIYNIRQVPEQPVYKNRLH